MKALTLRNISKRYDSGHLALKGIDLEIEPGEFVSLLGPSGCGKTTLLRCVAGLETVTTGEIEIAGRLVGSPGVDVPPHERRVGMVFQSYALWPHMSVRDNVAYPLRFQKVAQKEVEARVREILETLGIGAFDRVYPHQLSGGQQQRVALARALIARPALLLFDEPLSNLDARLRDSVRLTIRRLARELSFTGLYVTHDRLEAMVLSDRIVLLQDGLVVQTGEPQWVYRRPESRFAAEFMGDVNILAGTVASVDREYATVALGETLKVRGILAGHPPATPGDQVDVIIRVSSLQKCTQGTGDSLNRFCGQIEDAIFLGEAWRSRLRVQDRGLDAWLDMLSPQAVGAVGETVVVGSAPEDVVALPASTPR